MSVFMIDFYFSEKREKNSYQENLTLTQTERQVFGRQVNLK